MKPNMPFLSYHKSLLSAKISMKFSLFRTVLISFFFEEAETFETETLLYACLCCKASM
jgi:hypothetical protein